MSENSREALETYYKEAGSWAHDKIETLDRSKKLAWTIATLSLLLTIILGVALIILMPLKKVIPYTLLVDKHTGFVETLKPLEANLIKPDSALTQSFLVQYVTTREAFDIDSLQSDFRRVSLWSAEPERSNYIKNMQASNPNSPLSLYPRSTIVKVIIKSVSQLGKDTALVRFDTIRIDGGSGEQPSHSWASVVHYNFIDTPMTQEERFINPLGFQVLKYNRSEETLPPANSETSSANGEIEKNKNSVSSTDNTQNTARQPELLGGPENKAPTNIAPKTTPKIQGK